MTVQRWDINVLSYDEGTDSFQIELIGGLQEKRSLSLDAEILSILTGVEWEPHEFIEEGRFPIVNG